MKNLLVLSFLMTSFTAFANSSEKINTTICKSEDSSVIVVIQNDSVKINGFKIISTDVTIGEDFTVIEGQLKNKDKFSIMLFNSYKFETKLIINEIDNETELECSMTSRK